MQGGRDMRLLPVLLTLSISVQAVRAGAAVAGSCRFRDGFSYPPAVFDLVTCTMCYAYSGHDWFRPGHRLRVQVSDRAGVRYSLRALGGNGTVLANLSDPTAVEIITATFSELRFADKWAACCHSARHCCRDVLLRRQHAAASAGSNTGECPATEDGWLCWNASRAGAAVYQPCPDYIYTHQRPSCRVFARKTCTVNGTWAHYGPDGEYTEYGDCTNMENGLIRQYVNIAFNVVSALVLLPAVLLTAALPSLHSGQFLLHGSLMAALLVRSVMVVWTVVVLNLSQLTAVDEDADGGPGCRLLQLLYKYAVLSSWFWMLAVGLGLHHSVARPFVKPFKNVVFCALGWGVPVVFVAGWAAAKALLEDELCWMLNVHHLVWILDAPKLACFVINLVFMIDVLRILYTKLQSSEARRRSFRATAMLVPLFGLQFLVTALPPGEDTDCTAEQAYYVVSYLISGLQGAIIACIYFYTNAEVRSKLLREYARLRLRLYGVAASNGGHRRRTISTEPSCRQLAGEADADAQLTVTSLLASGERPRRAGSPTAVLVPSPLAVKRTPEDIGTAQL